MRRTIALVTIALAGALTPSASDAVGAVCVTGNPDVYAGCTLVVVIPGTYCYVWSAGTVAGMPYSVGPYRC